MAALLEKNQVGKREDLADLISIADASETPMLATFEKDKKPANMRVDWQADKYDDPQMEGVADGVDVAEYENAAKDRQLISAYVQRMRRTAMVGTLAEEVSQVAGAPEGELARALDKKLVEMARDAESRIGSDEECQLEVDKNTPYKFRGLGKWLQSTAQAVLPVPAAYLTPAASLDNTAQASLTETLLKGVLKSIYENYGKTERLKGYCGTTIKQTITGFTMFKGSDTNTYASVRTFNQDLSSKRIISSVTVYEGDFNELLLIPDLYLARTAATGLPSSATPRRMYVIPDGTAKLRWHTKPRIKKLPDMGGGPRAMIEQILTLVYVNPLRGGKFYGTT